MQITERVYLQTLTFVDTSSTILGMMTNTVDTHNETEKRVPAMITEEAHTALQELTQLLKEEKRVRYISLYEAASIAIVETAKRKAQAKQRREQRRQATAA